MEQKYWNIINSLAAILVTLCWIGCTKFRALVWSMPGIEMTKYEDLLHLLIYLPVYAAGRITFEVAIKGVVLDKLRQNDPDNFEIKQKRVLKEAFNSFWYSFQALLGFYYFYDTDLFPIACFGTLRCSQFFQNWPMDIPTPSIKSYFLLQMTFHIYTAIDFERVNWHKRVPEFNEMRLHHILAIFMIMLCYMSNTFPFGVTVLFIADLTDSPLNIAKFLRDMKIWASTPIVDVLLAIVLVSWTYFRGFVISICMMTGCATVVVNVINNNQEWFSPVGRQVIFRLIHYYFAKIGMLSILVMLNLYWCYLIISIAYNRVVKKDKALTNKQWGEKVPSSLQKETQNISDSSRSHSAYVGDDRVPKNKED